MVVAILPARSLRSLTYYCKLRSLSYWGIRDSPALPPPSYPPTYSPPQHPPPLSQQTYLLLTLDPSSYYDPYKPQL